MRYSVQASLNDQSEFMNEWYTNSEDDAERLFSFFLEAGVRPIRLIETDGVIVIRSAENGIRRSC